MQKTVRDGKVAVIYSPSFGAGWYTWNTEYPQIVFDPVVVKYVEDKKLDELATYVAITYPDIYAGGLDDLAVQWIPEGTLFRINEYDGNESVEIKETVNWMIA